MVLLAHAGHIKISCKQRLFNNNLKLLVVYLIQIITVIMFIFKKRNTIASKRCSWYLDNMDDMVALRG